MASSSQYQDSDASHNSATPVGENTNISRSSSSSPEPPSFSEDLSDAEDSFFNSVSLGRFPEPEEKEQPWRKIWKEPQRPTSDGKLLVACPKRCVYGSNNLGGY